jgi:hypothetical protein
MIRALVFVALLAGVQAVAQADVYRWIDAQGRVQYSDRWMPGSELVKVDKARQNPVAAAARQSADQKKLATSNNRIAQQQAETANAQAVQQDVAKVQQEQCAQAKDRYDKSIHARRIFKEGKDGAKEYISDADADAYRVKARADMQAVCGSDAK